MVGSEPGTARECCDLTIVLPRLNESRDVILTTLRRLSHVSRQVPSEIILVNDGGPLADLRGLTDQFPNLTLVSNPRRRGKGYSIRRGVALATGRWVFYSDIDLPVSIIDLLEAIDGAEAAPAPYMLVGQRLRAAADEPVTSNAARRVTGLAFRRLFQVLLEPEIADSQCPFKLIEGVAARRLFRLGKVEGYSFDAELIHLARRIGMTIEARPITWADTRAPWSVLKTMRVFVRMTADLVAIRVRWIALAGRVTRERREAFAALSLTPEWRSFATALPGADARPVQAAEHTLSAVA